jgi:hypothetical protein
MSTSSEFERLKSAFARQPLVFGPSVVDGRTHHVPARLETFGLERDVDFCYHPTVSYVSPLGQFTHVRVVGNPDDAPDPPSWQLGDTGLTGVAKHAASVARFFGFRKNFTIVLALMRKPKELPHVKPPSIQDINGGVTFINERLVIVWRNDPDFWKVLTHELVHLMTADVDESRVEATALRMWCAMQCTNETEYSTLLKLQIAKTRANGELVARTAPGATPIVDYTYRAACWLLGGGEECSTLPLEQKASGKPTEVFRATVSA